MKSFKEFISENQAMDEAFVRKGAVAAYALQGKKHGDEAVRHYHRAGQSLRIIKNEKSTDAKVDALAMALTDVLNGLISQRNQVGSVSAQMTAVSLL